VVQEPMRNEAWCAQRYRSWDPYTHTYLGFDGLRHGCPWQPASPSSRSASSSRSICKP